MPAHISSIQELEACVGAPTLGVKMKIIDHLDAAAARWIAASPIGFLGFARGQGPAVTAMGGAAGFARVSGRTVLIIPRAAIDFSEGLEPGQGAGVLFLIPGLGETLRANGRIASVDEDSVEIGVEECFIHCAKALIRSAFWTGSAQGQPAGSGAFVNASRFLALATMDAEGRIDISPKGDPAGLLIRMEAGCATLAERPGNRLAFGYRNMVEQPMVAALCLIPGVPDVVELTGRGRLTTDEDVRAAFVVEGKTPILATVIEDAAPKLYASPALQRADLWSGAHPPPAIDPAEAFVAHVKLNKARGAQATLMRLAVNRGLVAKGLESNYRTDLY
jgi:hypothetical protein